MHEMALMGDILQIIQEDASAKRITKVEKIELTVGEISNALPDALIMAFHVFKEQNLHFFDEHAELIIHIEKAEAECLFCSKKYVPDNKISICPYCDMPSGKIISGESFQVLSYEGREAF